LRSASKKNIGADGGAIGKQVMNRTFDLIRHPFETFIFLRIF